jgi:hypothetical protein
MMKNLIKLIRFGLGLNFFVAVVALIGSTAFTACSNSYDPGQYEFKPIYFTFTLISFVIAGISYRSFTLNKRWTIQLAIISLLMSPSLQVIGVIGFGHSVAPLGVALNVFFLTVIASIIVERRRDIKEACSIAAN